MPTCPRCASTVPAGARFCPRCGESSPALAPVRTPKHDASEGIPWAGVSFVVGILFAPAAVILGLYCHSGALLWSGIAAAVVLLLVVLLGTLF